VLTYTETPAPSGYYFDMLARENKTAEAIDVGNFPIANALLQIRNGLIASARLDPCFVFANPTTEAASPGTSGGNLDAQGNDGSTKAGSATKSSNSFQLGLAFKKTTGGNWSLALGPVTLGASSTAALTNDNSITVTFVPVGEKLPNVPWAPCSDANTKPSNRYYWCYVRTGKVNGKEVGAGGRVDLLGPDFQGVLHNDVVPP
jgi:hypothetical protein